MSPAARVDTALVGAWDMVWLGLATAAISIWFARPRAPLPPDSSWWNRSSRSYADWKGSWAPLTAPLGLVMALIGIVRVIGG